MFLFYVIGVMPLVIYSRAPSIDQVYDLLQKDFDLCPLGQWKHHLHTSVLSGLYLQIS